MGGYFTGHLVIFDLCSFKFTIYKIVLHAWCPEDFFRFHSDAGRLVPVKCNLATIITLATTLTVPCSVLLFEHDKGVEYV
jgi:hypothetical protein